MNCIQADQSIKKTSSLENHISEDNRSVNLVSELIQKNANHKVFSHLKNPEALRIFASVHCFCVYDFMFLAKALQHVIAPSGPEWKGHIISPMATRAINEIILEEESDVDPEGGYTSHYDLYLKGMKEIGADFGPLLSFVESRDTSILSEEIGDFVDYHTKLAKSLNPMKIAGAFFYGRESLLPEVFESIVNILGDDQAPTLRYYFDRHIELDGRNHSELGEKIISELAERLGESEQVAIDAGVKSLEMRYKVFDYAYSKIIC
jgi:hypothetical protein